MNLDLMVYILEIIYQIKLKKERAYVINLDEYENTGVHIGFLYFLRQNIPFILIVLV